MKKSQSGFTLIEVVIALGLMLIISITLTSIIRGSLDLRDSISDASKIEIELMQSIREVSYDLEHAFIRSKSDLTQYGDPTKRSTGTHFEIIKRNELNELRFTTFSHRVAQKNAKQSNASFLVYKVITEKDNTKSLQRWSYPRIPNDFSVDEGFTKKRLAMNVKSFEVSAWEGDDWSRDKWDSSRSAWRNKIPHMVKIELEIYIDGDEQKVTDKIMTVVYVGNSRGTPETKVGSSSIRWDRL